MTTPIDKSSWGDGPWQSEPDSLLWKDPVTSRACAILRHAEAGHLCGYVKISDDDDLVLGDEFEVHFGITFTGTLDRLPPGLWTGFDCGHFTDFMPGMAARMKGLPLMGSWAKFMKTLFGDDAAAAKHHPLFYETIYRDLAYVQEQVTSLAAQIHMRSVESKLR